MDSFYRFLFPSNPTGNRASLLILSFRILFGLLLMSHGIQKWAQFDSLYAIFPDPIGIGSAATLILAIFAEILCSVFFIFGLLYRLVMLPLIVTLGIAFFIVHNGSIAMGGELAFIYFTVFIILYITGPGKFSFDHYIYLSILYNKCDCTNKIQPK